MMFLQCGVVLIVLTLRSAASASCAVGQLPCDDGKQCISRDLWCDKDANCDDGSDEAYCELKSWWNGDPNNCDDKVETHLRCDDSGICFPKVAECDGYENCKDGFDEKYCTKTSTVSEENEDSDDSDDSSGEIDNGISSSSIPFITQSRTNKEVVSTATAAEVTTAAEPTTVRYDLRLPTTSTTTTYYQKRMEESDAKTPVKVTAPETRRTETTKYAPAFPFSPTPIPHQRQFVNNRPTHRPTNLSFRPTALIPRQRQFNHVSQYQPSLNNPQQTIPKRIRPPLFVKSVPNEISQYPSVSSPYEAHGRYASHYTDNGPETNWNKEWRSYNRQGTTKKPFHFSKDYAQIFGGVNANSLRDGEKWLLQLRSEVDDWGDSTARALIALALTRNGFHSGNQESEIVKRRFMVKLGADLIRNNKKETLNMNRLSTSILALLAVCENPRDFHGLDLTEILKNKIYERVSGQPFVNPRVYLTLCLTNRSLSTIEVRNLVQHMRPTNTITEMSKDMQSFAIQAFACYMQENSSDPAYRMSLQEVLQSAVASLLQHMNEDGSFGSVYSTALAAQALMSTGEASNWDAAKTMDFLRQQQQNDGSFGNMLATYFTLPALSGRSTLHLRNIRCNASASEEDTSPSEALEFAGPKQYIHYSIYFGHPLVSSHSIRVLVPQGINFLDVMKVAASQDANFRYAYEERDSILVYSLSGMPNDAERGLYWHLYLKQEADPNQKVLNRRERYGGDLRGLHPRSFQHVIFWYHAIDATKRK